MWQPNLSPASLPSSLSRQKRHRSTTALGIVVRASRLTSASFWAKPVSTRVTRASTAGPAARPAHGLHVVSSEPRRDQHPVLLDQIATVAGQALDEARVQSVMQCRGMAVRHAVPGTGTSSGGAAAPRVTLSS